jgi:hypothetical protein
MKRLMVTVVAVIGLAGLVSAQQSDVASLKETTAGVRTGLGINPAVTPYSLLDLSRISWSHSYSVAFFSGRGSSGSVGLWRTTMDYDISSRLHLSVNLGVLHNPGALWGNAEADATVLPGFRLDFRPSDNIFMSISVQQGLGYYSPYYGRPYYGRMSPFFTD